MLTKGLLLRRRLRLRLRPTLQLGLILDLQLQLRLQLLSQSRWWLAMTEGLRPLGELASVTSLHLLRLRLDVQRPSSRRRQRLASLSDNLKQDEQEEEEERLPAGDPSPAVASAAVMPAPCASSGRSSFWGPTTDVGSISPVTLSNKASSRPRSAATGLRLGLGGRGRGRGLFFRRP